MANKQEEIREGMAELEHKQWAYWTQYMLDNLTEQNIERWKRQAKILYQDLSDGEKTSDRKWADKSLSCLHSQGVVIKVKCPDCNWSQFVGEESVGMTPCHTCNSTGYLIEPLIKEA